MKFIIKHEIQGRIRIHLNQNKMSFCQADTLLYYLEQLDYVKKAKVYEQTADAVIEYSENRDKLILAIRQFEYNKVNIPDDVLKNSGRELNAKYKEKVIGKIIMRMCAKWLLPYPVRAAGIALKSLKYIRHGLICLKKGKLEVPVLDATAIGVSLIRRDFNTAGSVMFLLGIGEILEEWTHKKSVGDLARSMSLNTGKVWQKINGQEILTDVSKIKPYDEVVIHMGSIIPFDGIVIEGQAMVNQASLTGESLPVKKEIDGYVYAGTVIEEGELTIKVKEVSGSTRYEKIITMIEQSEKLKSAVESKAEHLADKLVPYTFLGTILACAH